MVVIPTYPTPPPDRNPMFLEKRVYQGSSGKVYPNPFTDRVASEAVDQEYEAVFLENEFIRLMILPEIGGRGPNAPQKNNDHQCLFTPACTPPPPPALPSPWS